MKLAKCPISGFLSTKAVFVCPMHSSLVMWEQMIRHCCASPSNSLMPVTTSKTPKDESNSLDFDETLSYLANFTSLGFNFLIYKIPMFIIRPTHFTDGEDKTKSSNQILSVYYAWQDELQMFHAYEFILVLLTTL